MQHDYRAALSSWQPPANDNAPLTADSFASLTDRRAYVQRSQRKPEPVLNLPQLERLGRAAPDVVPLWKFWRDLQCAPAADVFAVPEIIVDEGEEPANTGFSTAEQDLECRPTVDELQRAWESAPARRVSVHCTVRNGQRSDVLRVVDPVVVRSGDTAQIGSLEFRRGRLVRYGRTARGVPLKPVEQLRAAKGSRKPQPPRDFRFLVQTNAPVAWKVDFLAGESASTGRSGSPLECFAAAEQSRKAEEQGLRQALGSHAEILDLAIGDSTAREIGESRGHHGKHAERRGIFLINEAFAALRALVGVNILPKAV
ncbi:MULTISPECIES: hypothetical protein [Bradyrhizobium]|uniref:hypothetical protein n=1 Tax=Bradyrhizobium TaxID=374 RepID=UPI000231D76B|nr:hypothetical protein [Bradyrhizobium japonicum]AJA63257.1 hypothetical protein RN69_25200 [Bradyrhizobium japonicum]KMJ98788.1 hypothetical protein CF64_11395 [Bradyrhizobium japonicum]MCS3540124.1 hypothetical protein [Bradyrhizobium japonicum]MCS3992673.1 hypothetical protein [Bradyrhizobium japonicum]MCS4012516.1 hypothetical protein [Bradyrhizobium japonicum]